MGYWSPIFRSHLSGSSEVSFQTINTLSPLRTPRPQDSLVTAIRRYFSSVELLPITEKTITSPEILRQELETIKAGAIAYSREENFMGIIAMGVPVFNNEHQVTASLAIPIPKMRFTPEREQLVEKALKEAAENLSKELGFFR